MTIIAIIRDSNIDIGGEFMTVFLIVSLVLALLLIDTKYWNKLSSTTLGMCSDSLLLTFIAIVIFKIGYKLMII